MAMIPGGCHTYSKGDDQFPVNAPKLIESGKGCLAYDMDGREWLDWGMGLRSVILGHAYQRVVDEVIGELYKGSNFTRPSPIEERLAKELIDLIPCAEMAKFGKNGSDVTTASIRLARAATDRDLVAFPREQPFLSAHDWFIGKTNRNAGVPRLTNWLSIQFGYGDLRDFETMFREYRNEIAAVIMEAATTEPPPKGYLEAVREICTREGAILIFDEMITGFRWHIGGAQTFYNVTPDLACFGKAIANGFSVSALVGRRDLMDQSNVFLLSSTHGGETHAIAAALATIDEIRERDVIAHIWRIGERLQNGLRWAIDEADASDVVRCEGYPCSPALTFQNLKMRTRFLQEMARTGVLMPCIAPSFSHEDAHVDWTIEMAVQALGTIRDGELLGPVIEPVFQPR